MCAGAGDGFENEKGSCLNFFSAGIVTMTAPLRQLLPVADLEIAGGGDDGSEQSAAQRPPDDRRREAPEVVRGVGSGGGRPRPPPVRGFGGITPEKILKFYIAKDAF